MTTTLNMVPAPVLRAYNSLCDAQRDYVVAFRGLAQCSPSAEDRTWLLQSLEAAQDRLAGALGEVTRAALRCAQEAAR